MKEELGRLQGLYVSEFVPGQCLQQTQDGPVGSSRDLDHVMVSQFFIGTPVQSTPDPFHRASSLKMLKPASRHAVALGLSGCECRWELRIGHHGQPLVRA